MPSHIFSMLGMWQESIESNQAALSASEGYVHAMDFMVYAYLQGAQDNGTRGLVAKAAAMRNAQPDSGKHSPTGAMLGIHTAFAAIPARYAIERSSWAEAAALEPQHGAPAADAITYFARAMGSIRTGNVAAAQKDIEQLQSLKEMLVESHQDYWAEQVEIQRVAATAWVKLTTGDSKDALQLMRSAADREDGCEKHVAMENRLWPMRELLGEMLLNLKEPALALKEFETSLKTAPKRFRGFYWAASAAAQSGDPEKAKTYFEKLIANCKDSSSERPELAEAKAYLAKK
jgi:tetratricopeptide (TPR) repeat protein